MGNLNGDSKPDLALANSNFGDVSILPNGGPAGPTSRPGIKKVSVSRPKKITVMK